MNTFTTRSNAKRNAIKSGIPADQVEIVPVKNKDGVRFSWKQRDTKLLADVFPAPTADAPKMKPVKRSKAKPAPATGTTAVIRNGVRQPREGTICRRVWDWVSSHPGVTVKDVKAWAESEKLNTNNAQIEFYQARKFAA